MCVMLRDIFKLARVGLGVSVGGGDSQAPNTDWENRTMLLGHDAIVLTLTL